MQEIAPGLWHWTALNERIGADVSSYYLTDGRVLIDPITPSDGSDRLEQLGPPEHVVLSNRHHDRHCWRLRERFGCTVHCIRNGLHELDGRGPVEPFDFGQTLPGGIVVHEVDAICPDETALYIPDQRALACADGLVESRGERLSFVPDSLMDDPEQTKRGLLDAYTRLLELDFDVLLLAHGEPIVGGGKDALRAFIDDAR
jgi:glyoxylase-like metal-dependent hydrolase (beta-lactamase superfamily II)